MMPSTTHEQHNGAEHAIQQQCQYNTSSKYGDTRAAAAIEAPINAHNTKRRLYNKGRLQLLHECAWSCVGQVLLWQW